MGGRVGKVRLQVNKGGWHLRSSILKYPATVSDTCSAVTVMCYFATRYPQRLTSPLKKQQLKQHVCPVLFLI